MCSAALRTPLFPSAWERFVSFQFPTDLQRHVHTSSVSLSPLMAWFSLLDRISLLLSLLWILPGTSDYSLPHIQNKNLLLNHPFGVVYIFYIFIHLVYKSHFIDLVLIPPPHTHRVCKYSSCRCAPHWQFSCGTGLHCHLQWQSASVSCLPLLCHFPTPFSGVSGSQK